MVNKTILKLLVFVLNGCSMVQIVSFNIVNSCGICITSTRGEDSNRISSKNTDQKEKKDLSVNTLLKVQRNHLCVAN